MSVAGIAAHAGPFANTPEWEAFRLFDPERETSKVHFGASEAAAACGVSPYETKLELYLLKRGELRKEFSEEQQMRMSWGHRLERSILDWYRDEKNCDVESMQPVYIHPEWDWMSATPDGLAFDASEQWVVDAKNSTSRMLDTHGEDQAKWGEDGSDFIPLNYLIQGQQLMAVLNLDRCDFAVLFDGNNPKVYTTKRDDELIAWIRDSEKELAERVINGDPPDVDFSASGTQHALQALYGYQQDTPAVELPEDIAEHVWSVKAITADIKRMETEKTILQNKIIAAMHGAAKAVLPNGQKVSRSQTADSFVTEADVLKLAAKVGQVKRKGFERLNLPRARKDA